MTDDMAPNADELSMAASVIAIAFAAATAISCATRRWARISTTASKSDVAEAAADEAAVAARCC